MLLARAASGFALAATCLLPHTAGAVPIQAPNSSQATASAADPAAGTSGPRRPGGIPATSQDLSSGISPDRSAGPRRPVPGQHESALTAEK